MKDMYLSLNKGVKKPCLQEEQALMFQESRGQMYLWEAVQCLTLSVMRRKHDVVPERNNATFKELRFLMCNGKALVIILTITENVVPITCNFAHLVCMLVLINTECFINKRLYFLNIGLLHISNEYTYTSSCHLHDTYLCI